MQEMLTEDEVARLFTPIQGHPNYGVSKTGLIINYQTGRIITGNATDRGYVRITLDGQKCLMHRIVAEAYVENPYGFQKVIHKDRDVTNNRASNLCWANDKLIHREEFRYTLSNIPHNEI